MFLSVVGESGVPSGNPANLYVAEAVRFNDDRLHTAGADLTPGNVDSKLGIFSFWFKLFSTGSTVFIWHSDSGDFQIRRFSDDQIRISGNGLDLRTTTAITDTTSWHNLVASWDRGNGLAHLYVDGAEDANVVSITDVNIDYTRFGHAVGSLESAKGNTLDAEVADLWLAPNQFLDLSIQGNRERFRDTLGKPVDLGSDGSSPTGTAPLVFFKGDASVWNAGTNSGSAQDFTMDGSVTDATSSPSD